jgi:hypothetical protein
MQDKENQEQIILFWLSLSIRRGGGGVLGSASSVMQLLSASVMSMIQLYVLKK